MSYQGSSDNGLGVLRRRYHQTRPLETCEVINMIIMSVLFIVIIITSMFILNNYNGYDKKPSLVLWLSSFQTIYLLCILPLSLKSKKICIVSLIPYFTCLILSTNYFISKNKVPFETKISIYHFIYLLSNYGLIVLACNSVVYYNCLLSNRRDVNQFREERDIIVNYNIIPTSTKMITLEAVNELCSICMEPILSQQINVKTKCNHVFHKKCLDRWFSCSKNKCPNCRQELVTEV